MKYTEYKKLKEQGFEDKNGLILKKINNKLYIHYREDDEYFDFLNSKFNRKNNKIFFEDFDVMNETIIAKNVHTLERHFMGKNFTAWQFRDEVIFEIESLSKISETPLRWEK